MKNFGLCLCLIILTSACGLNTTETENSFEAVVDGELHYDYGKPISKGEYLLSSHAESCKTGGIIHGQISLSVTGQFRMQLKRSSEVPVRCLKVHRPDTTVEIPTHLNMKKGEPLDTTSVTGVFHSNEEPLQILNKTDQTLVAELYWAREFDSVEPPEAKSIDEISKPVLQADGSINVPLNRIEGAYEANLVDFILYEINGDSAYYRDQIRKQSTLPPERQYHIFYRNYDTGYNYTIEIK